MTFKVVFVFRVPGKSKGSYSYSHSAEKATSAGTHE